MLTLAAARPEIPVDRYGPPPSKQYGPPDNFLSAQQLPKQQYGPPANLPQQQYGAPPPSLPQQEYGPPAQTYGPPKPQKLIITKNVYVHVPPPEQTEFIPSQVIEAPVPRKHYKIIFIKAPAPPAPTVPVIPEQVQDIHKTLVYVLVKKPEAQPIIEIPKPEPTEPSKPEVYFIKYKNPEKTPAAEYGPPSGPY